MAITRVAIRNFMGITSLDVPLRPGLNEISGPNGAGKSTFLRALRVSFQGKTVAPVRSIRKGEDRAQIRVTVAGKTGLLTIITTFRLKDGEEEVIGMKLERGDESLPSTYAALRAHVGEVSIDPVRFLSMKPRERYDLFTAFVPGFDFAKAENLDRSDYDRRTEVNRQAKESQAAADLIEVPAGTPEQLVSAAELVEQITTATAHNTKRLERQSARKLAQAEVDRLADETRGMVARCKDYATQRAAERDQVVAGRRAEIARLEAQIREAEEQAARDVTEFSRRESEAEDKRAERITYLTKRLEAAGALPEPIDVAPLEAQLKGIEATNDAVRRLHTKRAHQELAASHRTESAEITERMKARTKAKQEAIQAAKLPIPGLSFGDGEVLLNGIPFDQVNMAARLYAAFALAVRKCPEQPMFWIEDASLMDDKTVGLLEELCAEKGVQCVIETVRKVTDDAIVLESGHLQGAEAA